MNVRSQIETVCDPLIDLLSREGFNLYHRSVGKDRSLIQLLRDSHVILGEVEAVSLIVRRLDEGYRLSIQLAVYGRDIVKAHPDGLEIVENAVSDMAGSIALSRNTVGILGMGALNSYQLQRRLFRCLDDVLYMVHPS
ncbi:MAG: hypothetical protein L0Z54_00990 [Thermoplasmata archaeon]|nr:hypothetical protein [Thermoplasmata archaeon]